MVSTLIFDCDGVLADTERDGHRVAFNATFREFGIPVEWSEVEYAVKLQIAGGKERMASLLTPEFVRANGLPADADGQDRDAELQREVRDAVEQVRDGRTRTACPFGEDRQRLPVLERLL